MLIAFAEYLSHASPFVTLGILLLAILLFVCNFFMFLYIVDNNRLLRRIESNLV